MCPPNNGAASCPLSHAVTRADLHEFQEAMFAKLSVLIAGQLQSAIEAILKPAIDAAMGPITSVLDGIGVRPRYIRPRAGSVRLQQPGRRPGASCHAP
ncbi:hypothetical protein DPEC_G00207200 [Dallia pectoralis]|uniref:Uncharacterized protein n=1 Tax=Dallia pectoralis TaxID=75939 RepID=A0ACC2G518_DALPE|nr:hypothetical protein DPEC_G00207200 [Dallia pectoralis]